MVPRNVIRAFLLLITLYILAWMFKQFILHRQNFLKPRQREPSGFQKTENITANNQGLEVAGSPVSDETIGAREKDIKHRVRRDTSKQSLNVILPNSYSCKNVEIPRILRNIRRDLFAVQLFLITRAREQSALNLSLLLSNIRRMVKTIDSLLRRCSGMKGSEQMKKPFSRTTNLSKLNSQQINFAIRSVLSANHLKTAKCCLRASVLSTCENKKTSFLFFKIVNILKSLLRISADLSLTQLLLKDKNIDLEARNVGFILMLKNLQRYLFILSGLKNLRYKWIKKLSCIPSWGQQSCQRALLWHSEKPTFLMKNFIQDMPSQFGIYQRLKPRLETLINSITHILGNQEKRLKSLNSYLHQLQQKLMRVHLDSSKYVITGPLSLWFSLSSNLPSYYDSKVRRKLNVTIAISHKTKVEKQSFLAEKAKNIWLSTVQLIEHTIQLISQACHQIKEKSAFILHNLNLYSSLAFKNVISWITSIYQGLGISIKEILKINTIKPLNNTFAFDPPASVNNAEKNASYTPSKLDNKSFNTLNNLERKSDKGRLITSGSSDHLTQNYKYRQNNQRPKAYNASLKNGGKIVNAFSIQSSNKITANHLDTIAPFLGHTLLEKNTEMQSKKIGYLRLLRQKIQKIYLEKYQMYRQRQTSVYSKSLFLNQNRTRSNQISDSLILNQYNTDVSLGFRNSLVNKKNASVVDRKRNLHEIQEERESKYQEQGKETSQLQTIHLGSLFWLWGLQSQQLARFLAWVALLPQRTLLFIRRLEMANIRWRLEFFKKVMQMGSFKEKGNHADYLIKNRKKIQDLKKMEIVDSTKGNEEKIKKLNKNFLMYGENKTSPGNKIIKKHAQTIAEVNNSFGIGNMQHLPTLLNQLIDKKDKSRPDLEKAKNSKWRISSVAKKHKRKRKKRSGRGDEIDNALKRKVNELHRISGRRKISSKHLTFPNSDQIKEYSKSAKNIQTTHLNRTRPRGKEKADVLRSRLLNLIGLVESNKNLDKEASYETNKNKADNVGFSDNVNTIKLPGRQVASTKTEDDGLYEESKEPSKADFELLKNIEILTRKFLGKKAKKLESDYFSTFDGEDGESRSPNYRRKRSDDIEDLNPEDTGEATGLIGTARLNEAILGDNEKESKQFLQKWSLLKKEANNLQTEVNSTRDKYTSASDDLAKLLKKGEDIYSKTASAAKAEGAQRSKLEENWKNVNMEFDKFKSDIAAKEKEILSDDKGVNPRKMDQTLRKLEDAVSEQGDPDDRILGEFSLPPGRADKLTPAVMNMKREASFAEQVASDELMMEAEDSEDDVLKKQNPTEDYSVIDFDYAPDAKFADEELDDIAEDADTLTGFDYEVDRHSDIQLEDVDTMLRRIISRRFRTKRHLRGHKVKHGPKVLDPDYDRNLSTHTINKSLSVERKMKMARPEVHRRSSVDDVHETNIDGDYNEDEQLEFGDKMSDITGDELDMDMKDISLHRDIHFNYRLNHSDPKINIEPLMKEDNIADKNISLLDEMKIKNNFTKKYKVRHQNLSDILGNDNGEVIKPLKEEFATLKLQELIDIPLGSNWDIDDQIDEIKREKEYLATPDESIDKDLPSDDEFRPFDEIIDDNMPDFNDIRDETDKDNDQTKLTKEEKMLENSKINLIETKEAEEKFDIAMSSREQRAQERTEHKTDMKEIEVINNELGKAIADLANATNEVKLPPEKTEKRGPVRSLFAENAMWEEKLEARNKVKNSSLVNKTALLLDKYDHAFSNTDLFVAHEKSAATLQRKKREVEVVFGKNITNTTVRNERSAKEEVEEKETIPELATDLTNLENDLVEVENSGITGYDEVLQYFDDDGDARAEEWKSAKPPIKRKKSKNKGTKNEQDIEKSLLHAKSVVSLLKEEEEIADHVLPPESLIVSERDLLEFGRKPDVKDVFVDELQSVGMAELSEDEINELNGPVNSYTAIEQAIEDPTNLVLTLDGIENEIKDAKQSIFTQTQDLTKDDRTGQAVNDANTSPEQVVNDATAEKIFHQMENLGDIDNTLLERRIMDQGLDMFEDVRDTFLRQNEEDEELDGSNVLGQALEDLDEYALDSDMDKLRTFVNFKDVQINKEEEYDS